MPLWLRLPFWFVHSLASFVWWTQGSRDYKASNKVREITHCKTSRSWDWNPPVACRCIACLRDYSDTHHGGTDGLIRARRIVTHAVRRGVVGTWSPAFCLCRSLPSVELRTHISFHGGPSDASDVIHARREVDTPYLHPLCSNDLLARKSIVCLAPLLSCLRDFWQGCLCRGIEQYGFTVIGGAIAAPSIRYL